MTSSGGKTGGRPGRGRFSKPSKRSSKKRLRHLLIICRGSETRSAIWSFRRPFAASRIALARTTIKYGEVYLRAISSRALCSRPVRTMGNGLCLDMAYAIKHTPSLPRLIQKRNINTSYYLCHCVLSCQLSIIHCQFSCRRHEQGNLASNPAQGT